MALFTAPTAEAVYEDAGHNGTQGLSAAHLGQDSDAAALDLISSQILPPVVARVNSAADESAYPYDFPLSSDVWKAARPTFTDGQVAEEIANQESLYFHATRKLAAADLLGRVVTTNDFWIKRAETLKAGGEALLTAAITAVTNTVKRTQDAQAQGRAGVAVISIDTEPKRSDTDPAGVFGYYGEL